MLTLTFLIGLEVIVNIWLYNFYRCDFEDNEIFNDVDPETNRKICLESLGLDFVQKKISWMEGTRINEVFGGLDENLVYINSEGFRGPEFTKEKHENTYRIFAIGGSTTFGAGVLDNQTYPFYLQEMYDDTNFGFNVEVINAGWFGFWSLDETKMIKKRLVNYEPNLFIAFDGYNDNRKESYNHAKATALQWKERWMKICEMGQQQGFDTIITLQPGVNTGKKILTTQEYRAIVVDPEGKVESLNNFPVYAEQLKDLKDHCSLTADLRGLFDHVRDAIFYDVVHTGPKGNKIIAQKMFELSLPIVIKASENLDLNTDYEVASYEQNNRFISNEVNGFLDESYLTLQDLVSYYKTPKVFSLIFQE